ncbi:MAG: hypothetical protein CMI31_03095 [Opitutae bacterium]|nr:hypothetical protein [Opitutae bacterium]
MILANHPKFVKQSLNYLLILSCLSLVGITRIIAQSAPPSPVPVAMLGLQPQLAKNLADGAVGLAATRLSLNLSDETGVRLLQFAAAVDSKNSNFLYLNSVVKLGREINPASIPVKVTDEQYIAYLLGVAKIQKPSYFKLLLYSLVGVLDPSHRTAIIEVHRARENGLVVDFDGIIQRLSNSFPPLPVSPNPLLPVAKAKRLGDGATKLAQLKFSEQGRQSIAGLNLMQFALAIDPKNENALFLKALLLGNHPLQVISIDTTEDVFFAYIGQILDVTENETVKLLLLHLSLIKDPTNQDVRGALQKAQLEGKDISFQALVDSLNRQTYAGSATTGGPFGGGAAKPPAKATLDEKLKNSQMRDVLVSRKWTLYNLQAKEEWFFEFRPIGAATSAQGTCKGTRGRLVHNWKRWQIRNSILTIDGYQSFKYEEVRRQWVQANGRKEIFFR